MRILSWEVRDYRGLEKGRIEPAAEGVTVVEGPNEAGKSSMAEALDLLFEELDSTTKASVKAIRPEGRDVGSEVAVEARVGRYRFRYKKRFNKQRETTLEIEEPEPESLVGREAHERVSTILAESIDLDLWRAFRVQQGMSFEQADLAASRGLLAALDEVVSGGEGEGEGESLFSRVHEEYLRYFTPGGREKRALADLPRKVSDLSGELAERRQRWAAVEEDLAALDRLRDQRAGLAAKAAEARSEADRMGAESERLAEGTEVIREREKVWERLDRRARLLRDQSLATRERGELEARSTEAEREAAEAREDLGSRVSALAAADARLDTARTEAEDARRTVRSAEISAALAEAEAAAASRAEAESRIEALSAQLAESPVDEALLAEIEKADREASATRDALAAGRPRVTVSSQQDGLEVRVSGDARTLDRRAELVLEPQEELAVELPGVVQISVEPGQDTAALVSRHQAAADLLERLLRRSEAADLAAARQAAASRRALEEELGQAQRELDARPAGAAASGGSPTLDELRAEAEALCVSTTAEAPDLAAASQLLRSAEEKLEAAGGQRREAAEAHRAAERRVSEAALAAQRASEPMMRAQDRADWARRELEASGFELGEGIEAALDAAERAAEDAAGALDRARDRMEGENVEEVARQAAARRHEAASVAADLGDLDRTLRDLEVKLGALSEQGLFDTVADLTAELAEARREADREQRRAAAASSLYEAFRAAREEARTNYREPLARRIEALGKPLFGEDFGIELGEDLEIARRRLGGVWLGYEELSAGAREQLAILARVAAALLVGPDGGVPLILDDVLGHSDPVRLEGMAQVLDAAADHCQVIVLTCHPDRFSGLPRAERVRLGGPLEWGESAL